MKLIIVISIIVLLHVMIAIWIGFMRSLLLTSRYELKKRAQEGNTQAKTIYSLTADGREVYVAGLFGLVTAVILISFFLQTLINDFFALIIGSFTVVLFGVLFPFLYGEKLGLRITEKLAPISARLLRYMQPVTRPIVSRIDEVFGKKSFLYSKEQLLQIIDDQPKSPYSDITSEEAGFVRHSLTFSNKIIRDYMIPRRVVTMVSNNDQLGPILLDELHKSGHSRFPVYEHTNPDTIIGTLYVHDLVGSKKSGPVTQLMSKKVFFVHEELDLNHALDAFIKTKHHLFVVVNNFEEFVGILTIEDVIEQLLGRQIMDEFDAYENLREVAALHAKRSQKNNHAQHV